MEVLTKHVTTIRNLLSSPDYLPAPVQSPPPIMVAGIGDKMLSLAAQHADIIAIAAQGHPDQLGERIDYIRTQAGPRFEQIELAFSFFQLSFNKTPDLTLLRSTSPKSTDEELMQSVTLLQGSIPQAAERIAALREQFGISYFTLNLSPGITGRTSKNSSPPRDNHPCLVGAAGDVAGHQAPVHRRGPKPSCARAWAAPRSHHLREDFDNEPIDK